MIAEATETQVAPNIAHEVVAGRGLSCVQAARRFPPYRGDKPVHASTVARWIQFGVKLADGSTVRLEAVRNAGRYLTTEAAIERFIATQTPQAEEGAEPEPPIRTPSRREKASRVADAELQRRGC